MPSVSSALFVISIDLEMSWGTVHHGRPHDDSPFRLEREVVSDVLAAMDKYEIGATWAVVGHLFLSECSPIDGHKHPELTRPSYPWLGDDWYDLDPCRSLDDAPTWYGPDMIEAIRSCQTPQEIGSHSFGHLLVGEPGCSREAFRTDLAACRAAAGQSAAGMRSFVYPRNSIGHLDILEEAGFTAFRGTPPPRFAGRSPLLGRLLSTADRIWPLRSGAVVPVRRGTLIDIPQTYFFDPGSKAAQRYGTTIWSRLIRRRLRHAVKSRSLFHLWFHPHNLATHRDRARTALDAVFSEARLHIDAGRLKNFTMGELADRINGSSNQPPAAGDR